MKFIIVKEGGKFDLPKKYRDLFKQHKQITIRFPWCVQTQRLLKTDMPMNCQSQMWLRDKDRGDKPYVPEGFIEINKERFKVKFASRSNRE